MLPNVWGAGAFDELLSTGHGKGINLSKIRARLGVSEDSRTRRATQRALHKKMLKRSRRHLKEAVDALRSNPMQYGCPRAFKVLIAGEEAVTNGRVHDQSSYKDEGHRLFFPRFGANGNPARFNNVWVAASNVQVSADKRVYTIRASAAGKGKQKGGVIALYLDFTLPYSPTGFISLSSGYYVVCLEPDAVEYQVHVSANAGAKRTADGRYLDWDEKSTEWASATWEDDTMSFAFDTVVTDGDFGKELTNEVAFGDRLTGNTMELGVDQAGRYSCWMDQNALDHNNIYLHSIVNDLGLIPTPPAERAGRSVKTVFPTTARFRFDGISFTFTGAYELEDGRTVYAVKGHMVPAGGKLQQQPGQDIFLSSMQAVRDPFRQSETPETSNTPKRPEALQTPALDVVGLMGLSPLVPDPDNPAGARDIVSSIRDQDVHNIITYYMEDDIRKTFIQEEPITLSDPVILAIAKDKPENAAEVSAFYRSLQAPYVVSILARSNLKEAPTFNGLRADAQLKDKPANSDVYDRHANALYQYRFGCQFPAFNLYLEDQQNHDYADTMRSAAVKMKARIAAAVADLKAQGGNPQAAALNLAAASLDIDELCNWAIEKKLFWAFRLYDHLTSIYLPTLYNQIMDGSSAAGVSQLAKAHSTVLSLLEHSEANPNGNSFTKAWSHLIMALNAAAVVPQHMDAACASPIFGAILEGALNSFQTKAATSTASSVTLAAKNAQFLIANPTVQKQFLWAFRASMCAKGSKGTWPSLVKRFNSLVQTAGWVKNRDPDMNVTEFFLYLACAALMGFPMVAFFPSGWDAVPADKKSTVLDSVSGMVLSLVIKSGGGMARTSSIWADVGSLTPRMKALFGFGEVEAHAFETLWLIQYQTAVHYNRAGPQSMNLPIVPDPPEEGAGGDDPVRTSSSKQRPEEKLGFIIAVGGVVAAAISLCGTVCLVAVLIAGMALAVFTMIWSVMAMKDADPLWKMAGAFYFVAGLGLFVICTTALAYGLMSEAVISLLFDVFFPPAFGITLAAAIMGCVLMIVAIFMPRPNPLTPVQTFVNKHAEPAGLMMPHKTAADYLDVVPSDATHPSLHGISLFYDYDQQRFLQLGTPTHEGQAVPVQASPTITHFPDTCWSVNTNSQGLSIIFTTITLDSGVAQGHHQQQPSVFCLTRVESDTVVAIPPPSETTIDEHGKKVKTDPEVYQQQVSRQLWKLTCASDDPETQTRVVDNKQVSFVTSARFQITHGDGDNMRSLIMAGTAQSGHRPALVNLPTRQDDDHAGIWTLSLQVVAPPAFQYFSPTWELTTESRGESLSALFFGPVSLPLTVSITPSLPQFLRLSASQDSTGSIEQVPETKPVPMKPTCFTVRAYIDIDGRRYEQSAQAIISVQDPDVECHNVAHTSVIIVASSSSSNAHTPASPASDHFASVGDEQEETAAAYGPWLDTTPPFFRWQQEHALALKDHWTAQAAISRMQDSFAKLEWRGGDYHGLYFPRRDPGPPLSLRIGDDDIKYEDAAAAFVALAIREGGQYASGYVDASKAQHTIEVFNASLQANNLNRFLEWLAWDGSIPFTGGAPRCGKQEYIDCLTSSLWIRMHVFLGSYWVNPSLEMFFHFLKLTALGATDQELQDVYNKLTVGQEGKVLSPGQFPDITPSSWRTWRAYLFAGPNNGIARLAVSNLGRSKHYQYYAARTVITGMDYADTIFLAHTGYSNSSNGGCCLSGASRVLMGDGRTLKPIDAIQPGETVMGPRGCPRVVTFVSRPRRNGRPLYAFKSAPDLLFTADHPIHLGLDAASGTTPILGFVRPAEALAINPLWAAFPLRQIAATQLLTVAPADAAAHDILFDLILDPDSDSDVPCYLVRGTRDSTTEGSEIVVCSEAPNPRMLPCATAFVIAFAAAIGASSGAEQHEKVAAITRFFPNGLAAGVLDYRGRIAGERAPCATAVYHRGTTALQGSPKKTMRSALEVLHASDVLAPQVLADATEAVVGSMGLDLQVVADNGWRHVDPLSGNNLKGVDQMEESNEVWVLSTHFLELEQPARRPDPEDPALPKCYQMVVDLLGDGLGGNSDGAVHVEVQLPLAQGWAAVSSNSAGRVAVRGVAGGRYLHRLRVDLEVPDGVVQNPDDDDDDDNDEQCGQQEVRVRIKTWNAVLVASGRVGDGDLATASLPVYVQELVGADEAMLRDLAHWHVAWLLVTFGKVQKGRLGLAEAWKADDGTLVTRGPKKLGDCNSVMMEGRMEAYAEMLGGTVGRGVIQSLVGGGSGANGR